MEMGLKIDICDVCFEVRECMMVGYSDGYYNNADEEYAICRECVEKEFEGGINNEK